MVKRKRQTIQWSSEKDRQYNGQAKKTDNTMVKRKRQTIQWSSENDRQYNGQAKKTDNTMVKRKRQTIQWSSEKGQNDKMHRKLKIEQHEPHKNVGEFRCSKLDIYVFLLLCKFQEIS
jgi:hypothetical protein